MGGGDRVMRLPSLDPRLSGDDPKPPQAVLNAPPPVETGKPFTLSGSVTRTPEGRKIAKYIWTRLD
jgi:hypothetical protein